MGGRQDLVARKRGAWQTDTTGGRRRVVTVWLSFVLMQHLLPKAKRRCWKPIKCRTKHANIPPASAHPAPHQLR